jgi:hypothetical protein
MLRIVVIQTIVISGAIGLMGSGVLLVMGLSRECWGLLFGTLVGISNQLMLANRVAKIGAFGNARATARMMQAGTATRFLMIGLAAVLAVRLHASMNIATMLIGLLLPTIVANVVGTRLLLRPDL